VSKINLGDRVKDSVTNFTGIVIGLTQWFWGCPRVVIQPEELKDGKVIDSLSFDVPSLLLIKAGAAKVEPAETVTVELGDRVEEITTKLRGLVVCKTQWISGCTRMMVQPEGLYKGKPIEMSSFDEPALRVIKKSVMKHKTAVAARAPQPGPGGPRPEPVRR
jgi:hypothetical protein